MLFEKLSYPDDFSLQVLIGKVVEDPIHYHPDVEFIYVLRGEVILRNGYCNYHLHAGDIFTNSGNEVHSLYAVTEDNVVARIHVSTAELSQYFPNLSKACYRTYSQKADDKRYLRLKELMLQLLIKYQAKGVNYKSECVYLMVDIIKHLNKYFNLFTFDKDVVVGFDLGNQLASDRISRICQYIYQKYADNITLEDLSNMEYLSPFYLSHLIKDFTGMNFREFLCFARVERSEVRLLGSNMKISQIARDVGFSTTAYYNKYFTRWFGVSPTEYRTQFQSQVKSDLKPAVYEELPPGESIAVLKSTLARYSPRQETDSVISSMNLEISVRPHSKAIQRFERSVNVIVTYEDFRVLGMRLFSALLGLSPTKAILLRGNEDTQDYERFKKLLLDSGLNVEIRETHISENERYCAFDTIAYPLYLLSVNNSDHGQPLEINFRDSGISPHPILQGKPSALTAGGLKKPVYFAYAALSQIKGDMIIRGNQYVVIQCIRDMTPYFIIIAYNYNDAILAACNRETEPLEMRNIINNFRDELNLTVNLELESGSYSVIRYSMVKENTLFSHLAALNFQEEILTEPQISELFSSWPMAETYIEEVRAVCRMSFLLKGAGIQAAIIYPQM